MYDSRSINNKNSNSNDNDDGDCKCCEGENDYNLFVQLLKKIYNVINMHVNVIQSVGIHIRYCHRPGIFN